MFTPPNHLQELLTAAQQYEQQEDVYNAIKLYKIVARKAPQWAIPFARLGQLYKERQEWKPTLHYNKKTVALTPDDQQAWWNLCLAATALSKWRLARSIWAKFGLSNWKTVPVCFQLSYQGKFEIVWGRQVDPVRAVVESIPHPTSDRRFGDIVLLDREIAGYNVVAQRRVPVMEELGLYKRSIFQTYATWLDTGAEADIDVLARLCQEAELGFEVWSRAIQLKTFQPMDQKPEYYDPSFLEAAEREGTQVAIAAKQDAQVQKILDSWKVICLKNYFGLEVWR
ncbi:MAG: hypothetical protein AAF798_17615 [Bacteroidota bacterium]